MEVETNSSGVNVKIKANILPDDAMRKIGFTDYNKKNWFFSRGLNFSGKQYRHFDISFSVTIPKDGSEIRIDVLDEDFLQPYDYQYMLEQNPTFEPALLVQKQVEEYMEYLQNNGVLEGHIKGEYI
jgi:hypothetical protein